MENHLSSQCCRRMGSHFLCSVFDALPDGQTSVQRYPVRQMRSCYEATGRSIYPNQAKLQRWRGHDSGRWRIRQLLHEHWCNELSHNQMSTFVEGLCQTMDWSVCDIGRHPRRQMDYQGPVERIWRSYKLSMCRMHKWWRYISSLSHLKGRLYYQLTCQVHGRIVAGGWLWASSHKVRRRGQKHCHIWLLL